MDETERYERVAHLHPLAPLREHEFLVARDVIRKSRGPEAGLYFREIFLQEPARDDLIVYLEAEANKSPPEKLELVRPKRHAKVQYDVIENGTTRYTQSTVDIESKEEVGVTTAESHQQPSFTLAECHSLQDVVMQSRLFRDALAEFIIPEKFRILIDPWPYGGPDQEEGDLPRLMQGLVYCQDTTSQNPDSNHYSYPVPLIPVIDVRQRKVLRVDRLSLDLAHHGWTTDPNTRKPTVPLFRNAKPAEYVPELLPPEVTPRTDLRPINITQPEGSSFSVTPEGYIEWQRWCLRVSFTPREGAVLNNVTYGGRPVMHRMSFSEMTVPYGDPRTPYHRKQAFDFGDGGIGRAANNLQLGCDCLGAIHYLSTRLATSDGKSTVRPNVVCIHEQDNGIGWKHTNFWTGRPAVTRLRELVIQFIITLANYEYVFAYKLDTAGNITVEVRATGMISVAPISEDVKTAPYGLIVAPGALAQNHQHVFAVRMDPCIDSYRNGETCVVVEKTQAVPLNEGMNIHGNQFAISRRIVNQAEAFNADPTNNLAVRLENRVVVNKVSNRNVGFRFTPLATQLLLAHPESRQAKRAKFAQHHIWVTGYRDGELWAGGEFTNMSTEETGGVSDMMKRGDWFDRTAEKKESVGDGRLSTPVVWSVFGLTHNPRMEDWPVMPTEIHSFQVRPADFFEYNPALDMPTNKNQTSVLVPATKPACTGCE